VGKEFTKAALEAGDAVVATSRSAQSVEKAFGVHQRLLSLSLDVTNSDASMSSSTTRVTR
jgi:hypothetical protein